MRLSPAPLGNRLESGWANNKNRAVNGRSVKNALPTVPQLIGALMIFGGGLLLMFGLSNGGWSSGLKFFFDGVALWGAFGAYLGMQYLAGAQWASGLCLLYWAVQIPIIDVPDLVYRLHCGGLVAFHVELSRISIGLGAQFGSAAEFGFNGSQTAPSIDVNLLAVAAVWYLARTAFPEPQASPAATSGDVT